MRSTATLESYHDPVIEKTIRDLASKTRLPVTEVPAQLLKLSHAGMKAIVEIEKKAKKNKEQTAQLARVLEIYKNINDLFTILTADSIGLNISKLSNPAIALMELFYDIKDAGKGDGSKAWVFRELPPPSEADKIAYQYLSLLLQYLKDYEAQLNTEFITAHATEHLIPRISWALRTMIVTALPRKFKKEHPSLDNEELIKLYMRTDTKIQENIASNIQIIYNAIGYVYDGIQAISGPEPTPESFDDDTEEDESASAAPSIADSPNPTPISTLTASTVDDALVEEPIFIPTAASKLRLPAEVPAIQDQYNFEQLFEAISTWARYKSGNPNPAVVGERVYNLYQLGLNFIEKLRSLSADEREALDEELKSFINPINIKTRFSKSTIKALFNKPVLLPLLKEHFPTPTFEASVELALPSEASDTHLATPIPETKSSMSSVSPRWTSIDHSPSISSPIDGIEKHRLLINSIKHGIPISNEESAQYLLLQALATGACRLLNETGQTKIAGIDILFNEIINPENSIDTILDRAEKLFQSRKSEFYLSKIYNRYLRLRNPKTEAFYKKWSTQLEKLHAPDKGPVITDGAISVGPEASRHSRSPR